MTQHDGPHDPSWRHYACRPAAWVGLREQFPAVANRTNVAAVFRVRTGQFWHLRLIIVLSLLVPAVLYGWAGWETWSSIDRQADQRIEGTLDVLQEQALKALQTVERSISEINEVLRGVSDEEIRAAEADLYLRFKRTQQALPQIESIWAFDRDGHPLVSSTILPVPRQLNNSDRSYFRAHTEAAASGTYVSEVMRARVGAMRFFVVSGRRTGGELGRFDGVIGVTIAPGHFSEFYSKLCARRRRLRPGAGRRRGARPLARQRRRRPAGAGRADRGLRAQPEGGLFTAASRLDGVERRLATGACRAIRFMSPPASTLLLSPPISGGPCCSAAPSCCRRCWRWSAWRSMPCVAPSTGSGSCSAARPPRRRSSRRSGWRPSAS